VPDEPVLLPVELIVRDSCGGPVTASAVVQSPVVQSPVVQSPVVQSPVAQSTAPAPTELEDV
jgi:hypothetical protein